MDHEGLLFSLSSRSRCLMQTSISEAAGTSRLSRSLTSLRWAAERPGDRLRPARQAAARLLKQALRVLLWLGLSHTGVACTPKYDSKVTFFYISNK